MIRSLDSVDGRNPAPPGMYKAMNIMGEPTNLNWLARFQPSRVFYLAMAGTMA